VCVCVFIVLTGLANRLLLVFGAACFNLCSVCRYCWVLLVPAFFPSIFFVHFKGPFWVWSVSWITFGCVVVL